MEREGKVIKSWMSLSRNDENLIRSESVLMFLVGLCLTRVTRVAQN